MDATAAKCLLTESAQTGTANIAQDHRAADVIRRLGALFRRGEMQLHSLDLNALVTETLDLVQLDLLMHHVIVITDLAPELSAIEGDRVQLKQVLFNLVVNAADAMADTAAHDRAMTIRTTTTNTGVQLQVSDRGPGIPPEFHATVFDPFWSSKATGIGMGLSVCRSIVSVPHGTLTVENAAGGGPRNRASVPPVQVKGIYL